MILIVGSEGAQGRRYKSILAHLGVPYLGVDLNRPVSGSEAIPVDGVIIATPTDTHVDVLLGMARLGVPFLVEKPFTKKPAELKRLSIAEPDLKFSMVMQYRQISRSVRNERTWYDYFRHGNDGLTWDCLQPIALARGDIHLSEASPVWDCVINGERLDIHDMDRAYVLEVEDWLRGRTQSYSEIIDIHEKVAAYARGE